MIESAIGHTQFAANFLYRHLLIAFGVHQALRALVPVLLRVHIDDHFVRYVLLPTIRLGGQAWLMQQHEKEGKKWQSQDGAIIHVFRTSFGQLYKNWTTQTCFLEKRDPWGPKGRFKRAIFAAQMLLVYIRTRLEPDDEGSNMFLIDPML